MRHNPKSELKCATAQQIARDAIAGHSIDQDQKMSLAAHLKECADCRTDAGLLKLFLSDHYPNLDRLASKRCRDAALADARRYVDDDDLFSSPQRNRHPGRRFIFAAAAVLLTAVAAGAIVKFAKSTSPVSSGKNREDSSIAKTNAQEIVPSPQHTDVKTAGLAKPATGVLVWAEGSAGYDIVRNDSQQLHIRLNDGAILVDVNPSERHPSVQVQTDEGTIAVTGTVFRVEKKRDVDVQVLRGTVRVTNKRGGFFVSTGKRARLSDIKPADMDEQFRTQLAHVWETQINSKRTVADKGNDDDVDSTVESESLDNMAAVPNGKEKPSVVSSDVLPFSVLIEKARQKKSQREYTHAIDLYQQLRRQYPSKPESKAALVVVGQLYLKTGDAKKAQRAFRRYEAEGQTSLLPEALLGLADAYRIEGNTSRELHVLRRFEHLFPTSLQLKTVQARIEKID